MKTETVTLHIDPVLFGFLAVISKAEHRELDAQAQHFLEQSIRGYLYARQCKETPVKLAVAKKANKTIPINKKRGGWKWTPEARSRFSKVMKRSWKLRKQRDPNDLSAYDGM